MSTSFKGRALALVAGGAFAAGGLTILLGSDLTKPLEWTSLQWLTILTVFGTIAAGHLMVDAWRARHLFATLGFFVLFMSGTGLVVYSSVGRQVESAGITTLSVQEANSRLEELKAERQKAVARRDYADQQAAFEIAGRPDKRGRKTTKAYCGKACHDWQQNSRDVSAMIEKIDKEIAKIGPAKPVNAQAAAFADMAALFGADNKARTIAMLMLLVPFAKCLFFEIGSIVSLGFAFRSGRVSIAKPANDFRNDFQPEIKPPPSGPKVRKLRRLPDNVVPIAKHPAVKALEQAGGSVSSNQMLASLMEVSEGESSKRVQEIEHLIERRKVGKQLTISLRKSA